MDIVGNLPVELAQNIFMYLLPEDLCSALKCCDKWKQIVNSEYFWKRKMEVDFDVVGEYNLNTPSYQNFVQKFANLGEGQYMYLYKLDRRWRRGSYKYQQFSLPWKINQLIYVDEEILMVAVNYFAIAIINVFNGTVEHLFLAERLFFAEKCDNLLYAFSKGGAKQKVLFKVWDLKTREQICNIQTELFPQCCSKSIYKHLIAYVALDHQLHIFNMNTGQLEYRKDSIYSVHCSKGLIAMGGQFGHIEILDVNYKPLMNLTCCSDSNITDLEIKNDYLVILCSPRIFVRDVSHHYYKENDPVCVWNLKTQTMLCRMKTNLDSFFEFAREKQLPCTDLENYAFFNLLFGNTFRRSVEVFDSREPEYFLISNGRYMFTGHGAHSLAYIMCPKTHRSYRNLNLDADFNYDKLLNRQCFFPIVSKTNLAYINETETHSVVILDFGYIAH